jgi:V/A-type H+-transporting ATPase subunit F
VVEIPTRTGIPRTDHEQVRSQGYAALFIEEALFSEYQQVVDEVNESTDMCIIPVPNQIADPWE